MTKQEFDDKVKTLKPVNDFLNFGIFFDMLAGLGSIIWLIWGCGSGAWKLLATTVVLFFAILFFYYILCYKYFKEGAEDEMVTEAENEPQPRNEYGEQVERPTRNYENPLRFG